MKPVFSLVVVLLCSFFAVAQVDAQTRFSLTAKLAPFAFFDPNGPTLQPGIGATYKQWGIHAEYGFHAYPFRQVQSSRKRYLETARYRTEIRYYPARRSTARQPGAWFGAVEGFWVAQKYGRSSGRFQVGGSETVLFYDTATVHRKVAGGTLKGGYESFLGKRQRFMLEASGGVGLRQVTIRHRDIGNIGENSGGVVQAIVDVFRIKADDEHEGSRLKPHLSLTLRVGYRLF